MRYDQGAADPARLSLAASKLGLDMAKFDTCVSSPATTQYLDATNTYANSRGVTSTPTVYLNGVQIQPPQDGETALSLDDLRATIEAASLTKTPQR